MGGGARFFETATIADVRACLDAGADPKARDRWGASPLHAAAHHGRIEIVAAILNAGANPDARTDDGITPLHMAASSGHGEAGEILLDAGADPNARDAYGTTALNGIHTDHPLIGTQIWWRLKDAKWEEMNLIASCSDLPSYFWSELWKK